MLIEALTLLVALSAYLHIRAEYRGPRRQVYLFKPLTMLGIISIAAVINNPVSDFYKAMIIMGLIFSLSGDIFLMLPQERFVAGLASFLVAHLFYISAFAEGTSLSFINLVPFLIIGSIFYGILMPHLGNLKMPVLVYAVVILGMAWLSLNRWLATNHSGSVLALTGALFFVASDSLLAFDRFKAAFSKARFYVLTTYFMAQWLIAFSITSGQV